MTVTVTGTLTLPPLLSETANVHDPAATLVSVTVADPFVPVAPTDTVATVVLLLPTQAAGAVKAPEYPLSLTLVVAVVPVAANATDDGFATGEAGVSAA